MTMISVPVYDRDHAPSLPEIRIREHNWMGRIVYFIRAQEANNLIYRVFIQTLAALISIALCLSIVGTPLFIYGFKEYIIQIERARFDHLYVELHARCTEHTMHQFLKGRLGPLDEIDIKLKPLTRQKMIRDLKIKPEEGEKKGDMELLQMVAVKYADFLIRYHLTRNCYLIFDF